MKLPSLRQVSAEAGRTFRRFPLVMADALIGTVSAVILIDYEGPPGPSVLFNILFACVLGLPLLIALSLMAEKGKWQLGLSAAVQGAGVLLLAAYAVSVPSDIVGAPSVHILRLLMLAVALHFFVAVAPFIRGGGLNGFWHYNKTFFMRAFTALLYTGVLYAGLSIALAALDHLFGMNVPVKRYGELWVLINGIFTTWFFLAGVPEDLEGLEKATDYPKGIKIFAQYILLPLVLVYAVILYAYLGKILISWDWPQGWVSKLILGFSTAGMLSLLLLYPVRDRAENVWIRTLSRWFYIVMIPLVIMLFPALSRRMSEYGITEGRYIAISLGVWLALMVVYFTFSRAKSIKVIPGSLWVCTILISFGPWGAFEISCQSQAARLKEILVRDSILAAGTVQKAPRAVAFEDVKQISSILSYLHDIHGFGRIQPWFHDSLAEDPAAVAKLMGIEYVNVWLASATNEVLMAANRTGVMDIAGYDHLLRTQYFRAGQAMKETSGDGLSVRVSSGLDTIIIISNPEGIPGDSLALDLRPLAGKLLKDYGNTNARNLPPEKMSLEAAKEGMKIKVYLQSLDLRTEATGWKFLGYEAAVLCTTGRK